MAIIESPVIELVIGGPQVRVDVRVINQNDSENTTTPLAVTPSPQPNIATIVADPDNPRAVILTPGTVPVEDLDLFVNTNPQATNSLRINVRVLPPAPPKSVEYVGHAPVQSSLVGTVSAFTDRK
jgi:hypothetical protein